MKYIYRLSIPLIICILVFAACSNDTVIEPTPTQDTIIEEPAETPEEIIPEVEEPIIEEDAIVLHSGLREDGSFDEGTLFIGDSLTVHLVSLYLEPMGYLGDAKYVSKIGASQVAYSNGLKMSIYDERCLFSEEFYGKTYPEAAAIMGESARAIYVMLGTNISEYATKESYMAMYKDLLTSCPNATVYAQTIPYTTSIPYEKVNEIILSAYNELKANGEERIVLLDSCAEIGENIIFDGVHMTDAGREAWYNGIVKFANENNIAQ